MGPFSPISKELVMWEDAREENTESWLACDWYLTPETLGQGYVSLDAAAAPKRQVRDG